MKRFLHISAFTLGLLIVAIIALLIAVQTPRVQTFLAEKAVAMLQDKLGGDIEFSEIQVHPFDAVVVKDVVIIDREPVSVFGMAPVDTIAKAKYIVATFSAKGIFKKEGIHIRRAYLSDAQFNLVAEPGGTNLQRFLNTKKKEEKKPMGNIFDAQQVEVQNLKFTLTNLNGIAKENGRSRANGSIDWNRLNVTVMSLKGKDVNLGGGYMSGEVVSAELKEKSGYHIHSLSAKAKVGGGKADISSIKLSDNWSIANIPSLVMNYDDASAFSDFIAKVRLGLEIKDSRLDIRSLGYFAPGLKGKNLIADIQEAKAEGYINDITVKKLKFVEELSNLSGSIKGRVSGLPDSRGMLTDIQNCELNFTSAGISRLIGGVAPNSKIDISKFGKGQTFSFKGTASGPLNRLAANGSLSSGHGNMAANLDIRNLIDPERPITIGTSIQMRNLNIGKIADVEQLGECSMKTVLSATLTPGNPSMKLDSLTVDKIEILGYPYTGIAAVGTYSDQSFDGRVVCNDPNLNFLFQGIINTSRKTKGALYKFYASLGYADLQALNIDKRGTSRLSGVINANYVRVDKGDLTGTIDVTGLNFEDNSGRHNVGNISIASHQNDDVYRINLNSAFAEGSFIGGKSIMSLITDIQDATVKKELPALFKQKPQSREYDNYSINVNFHDTRDILSLLKPGLYIADSTTVSLNMAQDGLVSGKVRSQRIALGNKYLKDLNLSVDNKDGSINGTMRSSEFSLGPLSMKSNAFVLYADDNRLGVGYSYDNETEKENKGEIFLTGILERDLRDSLSLGAQTLPSNIYYNGDAWAIKPATLKIKGSDISIENLVAECGEQFISVTGGMSSTRKETLNLSMSKFDISLLNGILNTNYGIKGFASGEAFVHSPMKNGPGIIADLYSEKTEISGQPVGRLDIASTYENGNIHITAGNLLDDMRNLDLIADYKPAANNLDATITLDGLNAGYAYPILNSVFCELDGRIDGKLRLHGPLNDLDIESEGTRFNGVGAMVDYLKVKYIAHGPIHIDNSGLHFDEVDLRDNKGGRGTLTGAVTYNKFKNLGTDIHIHFDSMEALNLTEKDNDDFYGNIFGTGNVSITGPLNSITIDAEATTTKAGSFHLPISGKSSTKKSDLLVFKEEEHYVEIDPYELMMNRIVTEKKKSNDLAVKLKITATPVVTAFLEIDKEAGTMLSGNGSGIITVEVRPSKDIFSLGGDYTLTSGNFHFNAMNLAQRDFSIQDGSSVRFAGDVMDTDLDINAVYSTKTSLASLIPTVDIRRTVNCGIAITDKISNPSVSFSIDIPDLDPTTKSLVDGALTTEDKIQKQFLYLLIANNFLPDEQSGIANNSSNMLYSNMSQIMSNQFNNIMERLDIPLDLGLNYQPDEKSGKDLFDVAVSTQLFNNRVIVNGTVGSRQYTTNAGQGDVVGDLDIDVKLDPAGQFRFNMFSHSADDYTNYLDNTQRNGVGITYQKEFNSLKDILKSIFISKKRQQRREEKMLNDPHHHHDDDDVEMVTIKIENDSTDGKQ